MIEDATGLDRCGMEPGQASRDRRAGPAGPDRRAGPAGLARPLASAARRPGAGA